MHTIDAEDDCLLIDSRLVRSNALITTTLLAASLILPRFIAVILLAFQSLVFLTGVFAPKKSPYPKISKALSLPKLFKKGEGEHPKPVRFSQQVGLLFILPAFFLFAFGSSSGLVLVGVLLTGLCQFASSINAFAGICLACKIYPRLTLLRHRFYHLTSIQIR